MVPNPPTELLRNEAGLALIPNCQSQHFQLSFCQTTTHFLCLAHISNCQSQHFQLLFCWAVIWAQQTHPTDKASHPNCHFAPQQPKGEEKAPVPNLFPSQHWFPKILNTIPKRQLNRKPKQPNSILEKTSTTENHHDEQQQLPTHNQAGQVKTCLHHCHQQQQQLQQKQQQRQQ